jgi:hypothetical protein
MGSVLLDRWMGSVWPFLLLPVQRVLLGRASPERRWGGSVWFSSLLPVQRVPFGTCVACASLEGACPALLVVQCVPLGRASLGRACPALPVCCLCSVSLGGGCPALFVAACAVCPVGTGVACVSLRGRTCVALPVAACAVCPGGTCVASGSLMWLSALLPVQSSYHLCTFWYQGF